MILKTIDSKEEDLKILKELYKKSNNEKQKQLILSEIKKIENGFKAEKDNAYYLDFYLKDDKKVILIHDLRLEFNGKTAQIDHILISPLGIILLESKSFKGHLTIKSDNSLQVKYGNKISSFPNPLEQSKRHSRVLKEIVERYIEIPNRIKLLGGIDVKNSVLINPKTTVTNNKLPTNFYRSDSFVTEYNKMIDKLSGINLVKSLATFYTEELRLKIAQLLIGLHKPISINYTKKFPIKKQIENSDNVKICPRCKEGKLIVRESKKKTSHKNSKFLGCSRFPKCRYTEEIEAR